MSDLTKLTIAQARDAMRKGETSSAEITSACLTAIEGADALGAFVHHTPEIANTQAAAADTRIKAGDAPDMCGIPLGIKDLFVTSDGHRVNNPRHTARYARKLAKAQRRLSRKQKGSNNRAKARLKVARCHAKIADTRRDHLHKLTRQIVNENQVIAAESLQVKNMVKNRHLSNAISDVGWGELVRQLDYKAAWAGRQFVQIDRWYPSSKRCHSCGFVLESLPLNVRTWDCPDCGTQGIDRDVNAARNILQAGTALLAGADG